MSEYTGPNVRKIHRAKGFRSPSETYTYPADLTGHTAHLVIEDSTGANVATIAGTVAAAAVSTITIALDAASVATAGTFSYSLILDKDSPTLAEAIEVGDWIVTDYAGA